MKRQNSSAFSFKANQLLQNMVHKAQDWYFPIMNSQSINFQLSQMLGGKFRWSIKPDLLSLASLFQLAPPSLFSYNPRNSPFVFSTGEKFKLKVGDLHSSTLLQSRRNSSVDLVLYSLCLLLFPTLQGKHQTQVISSLVSSLAKRQSLTICISIFTFIHCL